MNLNEDIKYWVAFSRVPKIGATRLARLYGFFSSMQEAWQASFSDLMSSGLEEKIVNEFFAEKNSIDPDAEWKKLEKENIKVVTIGDKHYPKLLKEIIPQVVNDLVKNGFTIVSGLALGVDALAHKTTVDCKGKTVAVLGSGIDEQNIYPTQNRYLASEIIKNGGAVISEYPLGTIAFPGNFPFRNRIISGLSLGTLVIEAAEESGALITAKYALDQNREVFAVPGSIFSPTSAGPNKLIKMGARVVTSIDDILETLNLANATEFIKI